MQNLQNKCFIIAEAGVNHNGDLEIAKKMIDRARYVGADAIKFQTFKAENLVTKKADKADYQKENTTEDSQYEMLKNLELSFEVYYELKNYCDSKGIKFLSTPFDIESATLLNKLDVNCFKISSGDLTDLNLLEQIAIMNKPVILSTGMANLGEVEIAINTIREYSDNKIILLHCTSNYPTKYEDVNLKAMKTLHDAFKLEVGYSDHTNGIEVAIAAVAMGAKVIEKHFTLDKSMNGPDHKASLDVEEFKNMVTAIRNIEISFGDGIKKANLSEENTKKVARKSLVTTMKVQKGQIIEPFMVTCKRPDGGIKPKYMKNIVGKKALNDIEQDQMIKWTDIESI